VMFAAGRGRGVRTARAPKYRRANTFHFESAARRATSFGD
jgi:hypothetical protein